MVWGSFGVVHIASLLFGAGVFVGLYYLLRRFSVKTQMIVLGCLSIFGYVSTIFNLLNWGSPYEYLPLHLCSLTAIALPFAIFTRSKVLGNLLLLWSLGAVAALVVNTAQAEYKILSPLSSFTIATICWSSVSRFCYSNSDWWKRISSVLHRRC